MGGSPDIPETSLSQQVTWKDSAYTSYDQGKTYVPDTNKQFSFEGKDYSLTPEGDINDRGTWIEDQLGNYHRSAAEQQYAEARAQELSAMQEYQNNTLAAMTERNRIMQEQLAKEQAQYEAEKAEAEAEAEAAEDKRKKRLALAAKGRGTLLTGGQGDTSQAPVRRQTLGAV